LTKYNPEKVLEIGLEEQLADAKIELAVSRLKEQQKEIRPRINLNEGSFLERQRQIVFPQKEISRGHTSTQLNR